MTEWLTWEVPQWMMELGGAVWGQIRKGRLWRGKGGTFGSLQWRRRCYSIPPVLLSYLMLSYAWKIPSTPVWSLEASDLLFGVSLQGRPHHTSDRGEPAAWDRGTGWVWEITGGSYKTSAKLPIILEESIEYTLIYLRKTENIVQTLVKKTLLIVVVWFAWDINKPKHCSITLLRIPFWVFICKVQLQYNMDQNLCLHVHGQGNSNFSPWFQIWDLKISGETLFA